MPTTRTVSISLARITGDPCPYARVTFRLNATEAVDGLVTIEPTMVTMDANGEGSVALVPNVQSSYSVTIVNSNSGFLHRGAAVVPDNDCDLHDILTLTTPTTTDDIAQAVADANAAANDAQTAQTAAAASATAAASSATAAASSATAAASSASSASTSASTATTQATAAASSATAAATSASNAAASATAAAASETAAAADAAELAAVPSSYDGTRDPTTTDDVSTGASLGSQWLNTTTLTLWECVDNTTSAAKWNRLGAGHPGYLTSRFYPTSSSIHNTGTAVPATDTLYLYPFEVTEKITVSALVARIATGGTGSSMKAGVWANKNKRPFGAPLLVDNTGVATTTSNAAASCTVTGTLSPGWYWIGTKHTGTLPTPISLSSTDYSVERMVGRSSVGGNTALTALSISATYSSNMPTFDGSEVWTEYLGNGVPMMRLGIA